MENSVEGVLTNASSRGKETPMKSNKPDAPKKTPGTLQAEALRTRCNTLTEAERRKLRNEAARLYYGSEPKAANTRRG